MIYTIQAAVRRATGYCSHYWGTIGPSGLPEKVGEMPVAVRVEIEANQDGSYSLIRFGQADEFCGDTWHQSIEDAKEAARIEYSILESDWSAKDSK